MNNKRVGILGAGISGLTSAWQLNKNGVEVDIFERKGEAGGSIKTVQDHQWLYECGPNTLLIKEKEIEQLFDDLKLETVEANPEASKRFIVKNGRIEPLPQSIKSALKTPLFSTRAKARLLLEPFVTKNRNREQTIAEFTERRLGREFLDYAINPFVSGIYAGKPEQLSLKHAFPMMDQMEQEYGSLIWGAIAGKKKRREKAGTSRKLVSFKKGLQQLPEKLAEQAGSVNLNHDVKSIGKTNDGWFVKSQFGSHGPYSHIICTIPLHRWNDILLPIDEMEVDVAQGVNHPPLSVMILGYKENQISHPLDGFGFLVPEVEKREILGALFSTTLFPGRAPAGHQLLTVFIGGARQPKLASMGSEVLLKKAEGELEELIGLKGTAVFKKHIYWPHSIPQYQTTYDDILEMLTQLEDENDGLHFCGNYRNGISVPDCIKNGLRLGEELSKQIK